MNGTANRGPATDVTRRQFLRIAGLAGAGSAIATSLPATRAAATVQTGFKHVWRLSHDGEEVCRACRHHDRHRYYLLAKYAKRGRAHHGCNCDVIRQLLPVRKWKTFFVKPNGDLRHVWDTRWAK